MDDSQLVIIRHQEEMNKLDDERQLILISMLKPKLTIDGNQYCWLLGENLQEGIAGFGDSPYEAMVDFNKSFYRKYERVCPTCQSPLEDNGRCSDVGDNNCQYQA